MRRSSARHTYLHVIRESDDKDSRYLFVLHRTLLASRRRVLRRGPVRRSVVEVRYTSRQHASSSWAGSDVWPIRGLRRYLDLGARQDVALGSGRRRRLPRAHVRVSVQRCPRIHKLHVRHSRRRQM